MTYNLGLLTYFLITSTYPPRRKTYLLTSFIHSFILSTSGIAVVVVAAASITTKSSAKRRIKTEVSRDSTLLESFLKFVFIRGQKNVCCW